MLFIIVTKHTNANQIQQKYDPDSAWKMFVDSARSDLDDVQIGTTGEGIHLALMGGSLYTIIRKVRTRFHLNIVF